MTPIDLNSEYQGNGTRFRVYPQAPALNSISEPETIWVSSARGSVEPGPADDRMIVRDAVDKRVPYEANTFSPYSGLVHPPPVPDREGHFDYISPDCREFGAAHMYAVSRRVLDVWEHYIGEPIPWHFDHDFEQLELIPQVDWENAQSGYGFIEFGYQMNAVGGRQLYCLNFDIIAHEIGHSIIYSLVGQPYSNVENAEYLGFQESAADMTALIATLHFDSVVERLLSDTAGNLYALNELNRFAELSDVEQIRIACNDKRMSDFSDGWMKEHHLSAPLTGALFDVLVEIYHGNLIHQQLIDERLAAAAYDSILPHANVEQLQQRFNHAYSGRHQEFKRALLEARDYLGALLAEVWMSCLSPDEMTYTDVGHALLDADMAIGDGIFQSVIMDCFIWREIGVVQPGPRLSNASEEGVRSCR